MKSYLPVLFHRPEEQQGLFLWFSCLSEKAAWMEQFVLGVVAAGEGGMWLQGGSRWPCNPGSSLGLLLGEVCTCAPSQALLCKLQLCREL